MLVIFTAFSWYPITRLVVLSFQQTNLIDPPTWVGLQNFREVINDPLFATAVKNTAYFAFLALLFGYPIPLISAVLISEARRFRGIYSALAYLPVVILPVVGVMLWKYVFYEPSSVGLFNTMLRAGFTSDRTAGCNLRALRCRRSSSNPRGRTPVRQ